MYSLIVCLCDTHTSHSLKHRLLNLHYHVFPVYTPMLYVSPASSVPAVCSMPLYFKQEIYFKQLTGFIFYIDQQKGTFLAVSVIRHRIRSYCTFHARHINIICIFRYYSSTVYYLLVLVSHHRKKQLC